MVNSFDLFNKVSTGIVIINFNYQIVFWNNILERWTGLNHKQIVGKIASEEFEKFRDVTIQIRLESVFNYGTPVILSSQIHKFIIPCSYTGHEIRYQHTVVTSLQDPDIESKYLAIFSIQDVTDLSEKASLYKNIFKEVESQNNDLELAKQKLQNSNLSIQQIVEYSRDAIIIIHDNSIVFCNSSFRNIMNYKLEESYHIEFAKIQNPESPVAIENIIEFLDLLESYDTPLELLDIDKKIIYVEGRFRKIQFDGKPSILGIIRDMTEKIQLLELLYNEDKKSIGSGNLVTMCASCHNIKEDKKDNFNWTKIDDYVKKLTGKSISHGICNTCFEEEYPEYYKRFVDKHKKNRGEGDEKNKKS